jgi:hypothetical protein
MLRARLMFFRLLFRATLIEAAVVMGVVVAGYLLLRVVAKKRNSSGGLSFLEKRRRG